MQLVDWKLAAATGRRLVPPGPAVRLGTATAIVTDLRAHAASADSHVARITGLDVASASATTVVVDRPGWIQANVDSFAGLVDPLLELTVARHGVVPGPLTSAVGSRAAGLEVGVLLSLLATRVLGQFELLGPPRPAGDDDAPGRLTLVAPNILSTERALGVDPGDFRLWVCLHEVTHRTQFAAAPWLHAHVRDLLRDYLLAADLDPSALLARVRHALAGVVDSMRGRQGVGEQRVGEPGVDRPGVDRQSAAPSLVELFQTPRQREILDRITGLMSLLEGHADVVMDAVGPDVVPTVATIRKRFDARRRDTRLLATIVRRITGMDAKLRQYAEGARFVRAVIDQIGMSGLNTVWSSADQLPTGGEIRNPQRWLDRVGPPRVLTV